MPRRAAGLTAAKVRTAKPGRYGDGAGLYLLVRTVAARFWLFRYTFQGKKREMGLGPASGAGAVPLAEVRGKADELRRLLRAGVDPLAHRDAEADAKRKEAQRQASAARTFKEVCGLYIDANEVAWRNPKHRQQWRNTLETYAYPLMGGIAVAAIETGNVMDVLEPIWRTKPETATRLRGRIETVLDFATARGWRTGENPARWRGHVANMLPKRSKIAPTEHHAALPWAKIGAFMEDLAKQPGKGALALRFTILTAARTGEVIGAQWSEIDMKAGVWTVPAGRMKAGREHRVPLSGAALDVLQAMVPTKPRNGDGYVFQGRAKDSGLSNMSLAAVLKRMGQNDITVHGFRSTFRQWAGERTNVAREVAEAALAHTLKDKTEAAYARNDLFEKRQVLMETWATFCAKVLPAEGADVVQMHPTPALSSHHDTADRVDTVPRRSAPGGTGQ